ncbi:RIDA isoform 2 [Pan troglodytes]|uniref:Reactive intermediate imine deaminase A homolog n=2 Tax=Homininae TaxID=207598 RepID=E5RIP8_HUMAN|nr:RIDA isoform 2 [Pan troglodytes]
MSSLIRRVISTAKAPGAIGPYRTDRHGPFKWTACVRRGSRRS